MIKICCCVPGGSLMPEGEQTVPESPAEQIVSKCRYLLELGYDATECTGGMLSALGAQELDELVRENEKSSLGLVAVNSLFPGDWKLADPDADHAPYLERFRKICSAMERLGVPYAVFGSGGARRILDKPGSLEALRSFLTDAADIARAHGVTILIEPLRRQETNVFVTVPESGDFVREVGHPNLRLLCDAFHMATEETPPLAAARYLDLVDHCHVAEAPNRTPPGSDGGTGYLRAFASELLTGGYDGAVSAECGFKNFREDAKSILAYLKKILVKADTVSVVPVRDLIEEPVFLMPETGVVPATITSAAAPDGTLFPAAEKDGGALVVLTAKKGEKLTLTLGMKNAGNAPRLSSRSDGGQDVTIGGEPFGSYRCDETLPKPFFGPVTDGAGNVFTRPDLHHREHPHQRSVFVAVGDVNGVDCWNETPGHGFVKSEGVRDAQVTASFASFRVKNLWTDGEGNPLLTESTRYTVYAQSDACRALDLEITFRADHGDVVFGKTKEAGPLGIRLRDELRADIGAGRLANSWGGEGEDECWGRSAEWCDYYGEPDGIGPMGVTVFDSEKNERHPTAWHIRSYGLFAANNLYFKGGLTIPAGGSLTYRFRILFRRRAMTREEIADRFAVYTLCPIG